MGWHCEDYSPSLIIGLFDQDLRQLLSKRHVKITWNQGWQSETVIDPQHPENCGMLIVEDQ